MGQNFIGCDREQELLLPPSLRDWLPASHLAWFVLDAVEAVDLAAFYASYRADGWGRAAFEPSMMVALTVYVHAAPLGLRRGDRALERRSAHRRELRQRVLADERLTLRALAAQPRDELQRPVVDEGQALVAVQPQERVGHALEHRGGPALGLAQERLLAQRPAQVARDRRDADRAPGLRVVDAKAVARDGHRRATVEVVQVQPLGPVPVAQDGRVDVLADAGAMVLGDEVAHGAVLRFGGIAQAEQPQPCVVDEDHAPVEVRESDEVAGVADHRRQLLEAAGRAPAVGDVAMNAQVAAHRAGAVAHGGDDDLDLDRRAVLAHRGDLDPRPAVLEELALEVLALVVAGERRDLVGGDAEDLRRRVAVEPLGARVPVGDAEVRVGADDAVVQHVEQPGLKLLWHVRGPRLGHAARATHPWRIRTRLRAELGAFELGRPPQSADAVSRPRRRAVQAIRGSDGKARSHSVLRPIETRAFRSESSTIRWAPCSSP